MDSDFGMKETSSGNQNPKQLDVDINPGIVNVTNQTKDVCG